MKTCKDCLHYEACKPDVKVTAEMFRDVTGVEPCKYFTDRSEWVQVIRCENCKHCAFGDTVYDRYCEELNRNCYGMEFCSYGERKDERE